MEKSLISFGESGHPQLTWTSKYKGTSALHLVYSNEFYCDENLSWKIKQNSCFLLKFGMKQYD